MERFDLYDENRIPLGRTAERGIPLKKGEFRLAVHVCIFDSNGRMLVQQRQSTKEEYPNRWDLTAGGSAIAGETGQTAVARELYEELGLCVDFSKMRPQFTVYFQEGFDDIYLLVQEVDLGKLRLQQEEVQAVKWATEGEILSMIDTGEFIPYFKSLASFLFEKAKNCRLGARYQENGGYNL